MTHKGLTLSEAARYVSRHPKTLQAWDRKGILISGRTITNRRYWTKQQLDEFLGKTSIIGSRRIVAYCRVSSQAQKPDLKNQREAIEQFCLSSAKPNVEYVEEIGGGLNFKRKKFIELMDSISSGEISEIIIAHKDRLARFGFELLQHICDRNSTILNVINIEKLSPEQEMVQDLMTIIHCFSSRLYGLKNYKKIVKDVLKNDTRP